jgi:hypothetical protein
MLLHMKRTTLQIEPALLTLLRHRAAEEGRTLTEVLERTLRLGLEARSGGRRRVSIPSYDLGPFLLDPARRSDEESAPEPDSGGRRTE